MKDCRCTRCRRRRASASLGAPPPGQTIAYAALATIAGVIGWAAWKVYQATAPLAGGTLPIRDTDR